MSLDCRQVRDRLMTAGPSAPELARHLDTCPACARFASRFDETRALLRRHHAGAEPDAAFAARVVEALPDPSELLGWAALRLLPATLALALVLGVWCVIATPGPGSLVEESPTDDVLAWVVASDEEVP